MSETIALIGGGKMGEALLAGMVRAGHRVLVVEKSAERAAELTGRYDVELADGPEAVAAAGVVLVAVKPQHVVDALSELGITSDHLVISVAAGIPAASIEAVVPSGTALVRCMPNTPALVGEGMTAIAPGTNAGSAHLERAEALLGHVGDVVRVEEEQLHAVTALSGSGPAYFFAVVEAMVDAGVQLGLSRSLVERLVTRTIVGAGAMLRESGEHPGTLREAVTSPGGTTAAALREFDERGLADVFAAAVTAAERRSRELAG